MNLSFSCSVEDDVEAFFCAAHLVVELHLRVAWFFRGRLLLFLWFDLFRRRHSSLALPFSLPQLSLSLSPLESGRGGRAGFADDRRECGADEVEDEIKGR
ncbi:hypothetical protein HPP92_002328 [Vanilla planifolia]|uniref:Uncharacterized protein n=1 Tax=Vanilla planifolia TaxID=51239 RepID=A0A835VMP0_VANPL|nr:hypothetical protein HPP92_002328 [Vanilla planifolia]